MIQVVSVKGRRNEATERFETVGHWVELTFDNDHGRHVLELNGTKALPTERELRAALEFMLWDYGLLHLQDCRTARQRVNKFQDLLYLDRRNHLVAKEYMEQLGTGLRDEVPVSASATVLHSC